MNECKHEFETLSRVDGFTLGDFPCGIQEHVTLPRAFERCRCCGETRLRKWAKETLDKIENELRAQGIPCR